MEFESTDGATPLDPDEAEDLIPSHITTMRELNEWEQTNILQAERWIFGRRRRVDHLSEPFVRELHRRMFDETWRWAGQYRKTAKNIGVPAYQIAMSVKDVCEDVKTWLEQEVYPLDDIAIRLHHRLVAIHPFPNGNGRHTRLMADILLVRAGSQRFSWGGQNLQTAGSSRAAYLASLRAADRGEYGALLEFARS